MYLLSAWGGDQKLEACRLLQQKVAYLHASTNSLVWNLCLGEYRPAAGHPRDAGPVGFPRQMLLAMKLKIRDISTSSPPPRVVREGVPVVWFQLPISAQGALLGV